MPGRPSVWGISGNFLILRAKTAAVFSSLFISSVFSLGEGRGAGAIAAILDDRADVRPLDGSDATDNDNEYHIGGPTVHIESRIGRNAQFLQKDQSTDRRRSAGTGPVSDLRKYLVSQYGTNVSHCGQHRCAR